MVSIPVICTTFCGQHPTAGDKRALASSSILPSGKIHDRRTSSGKGYFAIWIKIKQNNFLITSQRYCYHQQKQKRDIDWRETSQCINGRNIRLTLYQAHWVRANRQPPICTNPTLNPQFYFSPIPIHFPKILPLTYKRVTIYCGQWTYQSILSFGMREEARGLRRNQCADREKVKSPRRELLILGLSAGCWQCEVMAPIAAPLYCP